MDIEINEASAIPVYEQIIGSIQKGVLNGDLSAGDSLRSIRQFAKDLSLTTTTIAKVYQILERREVIVTGGRRGTFIHESAQDNIKEYLNRNTQTQLKNLINHSLNQGIEKNKLKKIIQSLIKEL